MSLVCRRGCFSFPVHLVAGILWTSAAAFGAADGGQAGTLGVGQPRVLDPFRLVKSLPETRAIKVQWDAAALTELQNGRTTGLVKFPLEAETAAVLELSPLDVISPRARFVQMVNGVEVALPRPNVLMFSGRVAGQPHSHAFISFSGRGLANGYVRLESGESYFLSTSRSPSNTLGSPQVTVHRGSDATDLPEVATFCGFAGGPSRSAARGAVARGAPTLGGPQAVAVAVDADQAYVQLFSDTQAASDYVVQLIGAVSDIYIRDVNAKLILDFVRLWPNGGEPFGAHDLGGFAGYWLDNEDMTGLNLVHMFSGRRNTSYGGIAYLGDHCAGTFAISAFMLGSFPSPVNWPNLGNWDLVVVAHEMGHNMGTLHTHDGYEPPIDECGLGVPARSEIMSYCHTHPGGLLNTDLRFHARVQEVIEDEIALASCLWRDCNGNNLNDATDIAGPSDDTNGNGVPDECEDCNQDGTLDSAEILGGSPDVDGNGILDECEADCDGNQVPDEFETEFGGVPDANGNLSPDECEPDCNENLVADFVEIANGTQTDLDRNTVPDLCQDCDINGVSDWMDLGRQHNVYVADFGGFIREYHAASGVPIRSFAAGMVASPMDVAFGLDRQLYVASFGNGRIVRVDVDSGTASVFIAAGSGGLGSPSALTFDLNGNLFVSSNTTHQVMQFNGATGAPVGVFVAAGSGGLSGPYGLEFGPNGNLFVASSTDAVLEYSGLDGSFVRTFVAPGSGGLNDPRGIAFKQDGKLLVASHATSSVLQYDAAGNSLGRFNDTFVPTSAWGVRIGLRENVFVVRHSGTLRIPEYEVETGRYVRSFIRGDSAAVAPTGLAFRPASPNDCNQNLALDECDIAGGSSPDVDGNGTPDECEVACAPVDAVQPPAGAVPTNRFLSFEAGSPGEQTAIRVTLDQLPPPYDIWNGRSMWVGTAQEICENASQVSPPMEGCGPAPGLPSRTLLAATLQCSPRYEDWGLLGPVWVHHQAIVPLGTYSIQAVHLGCDVGDELQYSDALSVATGSWGDLTESCGGGDCNPPDGQVDVQDIIGMLNKFATAPGAPSKARCELSPRVVNLTIDIADVTATLDAFGLARFPYSPGTWPCP